MKLKTIFSFLFKDSLRPVRFSIIAFPLFLLSMIADIGILQVIGATLFFVAVLWLTATMLFLLLKGEWSRCFYILLLIASMVITIGLLN